jgi:hypothetical protein
MNSEVTSTVPMINRQVLVGDRLPGELAQAGQAEALPGNGANLTL